MKCLAQCLVSFWVLFGFWFQSVSSDKGSVRNIYRAASPPRGWNSYDAFSWIISEQEFLQNAEIVSQRLRAHGYEYVVVDYLWYRRFVNGANSNSLGFDVIDEWGRMVPDPGRWPSSHNGKGFSQIAKKVHKLGLKFGIHIMRGISTQAVNANTPILDPETGRAYEESSRVWHAKDIAIPERTCAWMSNGFMSVNTTLGAGRAFLKSLHQQYADWGVDLVKHDCVFGTDLDLNEITYVSGVLSQLKRRITYSLSPGPGATPAMARQINGLVNMYRVTGDDWDTWRDVKPHFDVARDFSNAKLIGATGLNGYSWPDLDMLPFGWLSDAGANQGPHRYCRMTLDEQKSQMTLWAMAKSPLMYGGDLRMIDPFTLKMITDPTLLEINSFSSNNKEYPYARGFVPSKNEDPKVNKTTHTLGLSSCSESKASGWTAESVYHELERICWKESLENKNLQPFCVNKRELQYKLNGDKYPGINHLVSTNEMRLCMDGSPKQKVSANEFKIGTFSPCTSNLNQMWNLTSNGTLVNSYSGLCATLNSVQVNANLGGVRSWVATGRKGELYLAFFNLSDKEMSVETTTSDLNTFLPGGGFQTCQGTEVWTGQKIVPKETGGVITAAVAAHGCAIFAFTC